MLYEEVNYLDHQPSRDKLNSMEKLIELQETEIASLKNDLSSAKIQAKNLSQNPLSEIKELNLQVAKKAKNEIHFQQRIDFFAKRLAKKVDELINLKKCLYEKDEEIKSLTQELVEKSDELEF